MAKTTIPGLLYAYHNFIFRESSSGGKRKTSNEMSNESKLLNYLDGGMGSNDHVRHYDSLRSLRTLQLLI